MFVLALGKIKSEISEDVLISMLYDDDVAAHAISSLGKLRSKKAEEKIKGLITHSRSLIRKEATKALERISK